MLARQLGREIQLPCCACALPPRPLPPARFRVRSGFCHRSRAPALGVVAWRPGRLLARCVVEASSGEGAAAGGDALITLDKLLDTLQLPQGQNAVAPEWLENIEQQGKALALEVDSLRQSVHSKSTELEDLRGELNKVVQEVSETHLLLVACQGELELKSAEADALREELEVAHAAREADYRASLARYRELEEALALAQKELEDRPVDGEVAWAGLDGVESLRDGISNQEKVVDNLLASLEASRDAKVKAENMTRENQRVMSIREEELANLQSQYKALLGGLDDAQVALQDAEDGFEQERKEFQALELQLRDELLVAERKYAEANAQLKESKGSLEALQAERMEQQELTLTLEEECRQLEAEKEALMEEMDGKAETNVTKLNSKVASLEKEVKTVKSRLGEAQSKEAKLTKKLKAANKDASSWELQLGKAQDLMKGVQKRLERKSNQLGTTNKEKRTTFLRAQRTGRQLKVLEGEVARVKTQLEKSVAEAEKFRVKLNEAQKSEEVTMANLAEVQEELGRTKEQESKMSAEMGELQGQLSDVQAHLSRREQEFDETSSRDKKSIEDLQKELMAMENATTEVQKEAKNEFQSRLERMEVAMDDERSQFEAERATLVSQLEDLEGQVQSSLAAKEASAARAKKLEKSKEALELRITSLQEDSSSGEAIVSSLQEAMELKGVELAEAGSVISEMTHQIESLQTALEEKTGEVEKTKTAMDSEKNLLRQNADALQAEVKSLKQSLESQRSSVPEVVLRDNQVQDLSRQLKEKENSIQQLKALIESDREEGKALRATVERSEAALVEFRKSAAEEMEAAAVLLDKAERLALSVKQSRMNQPQAGANPGSDGRADRENVMMKDQISKMQLALDEKTRVASDAKDRADALDVEVRVLVKKLDDMEAEKGRQSGEPQQVITSMQERLSEALEAESAAREEIGILRERLASLESNGATEIAALGASGHSNDIDSRIEELEAENARLKRAAAKKNQVIAQSRRFIDQYLERSVAVLKKK